MRELVLHNVALVTQKVKYNNTDNSSSSNSSNNDNNTNLTQLIMITIVRRQVKYKLPATAEFDMPYPEPFKLAPGIIIIRVIITIIITIYQHH